MFNFRYVFLLLLTLFSNNVLAEDYYYTFFGKPTRYSSASEACSSNVGSHKSFSHVTQHSGIPTNYRCFFDLSGGEKTEYGFADRKGHSCPQDTVLDEETGECVPEPNDCEVDATTPAVSHNHKYALLDSNGRPVSIIPPPASLCASSCKVNFLTFDGDPFYYLSGLNQGWAYINTW